MGDPNKKQVSAGADYSRSVIMMMIMMIMIMMMMMMMMMMMKTVGVPILKSLNFFSFFNCSS